MDEKCSNCGSSMKNMGEMKFRIGGYTGVAGMFLGGWNQLGEDTKTFTMYKCEKCGKVDFYEPAGD
ncbi:MAG: nucleotide-binding protein [Thermoplasmata archaeon]